MKATNYFFLHQYWIPTYVYLCTTNEGVVFLDLRRARYLAIGRNETLTFNLLVTAKAADSFDSPINIRSSNTELLAAARSFEEAGLLTSMAPTEPHLYLPTLATPSVAIGENVERYIPIGVRHIETFLRAAVTAIWSLRFRSFESVLRTVYMRKINNVSHHAEFDPEFAAELISIFRFLRTYCFSVKDKCLWHALTLVNFLACYQIYPTWVIGIKTDPWSAHSWIQHGEEVFDSSPERVLDFTPILTV